jgi:hypothetical protein
MFIRLPLEVNKRPAHIASISATEFIQHWTAWNDCNMTELMWVIAKLYYRKRKMIWYSFDFTKNLSSRLKERLTIRLKRIAYFDGCDADVFEVIPTSKDGIYFSWKSQINQILQQKRRKQRRRKHLLKHGTEGEPHQSGDPAPQLEDDAILPPSLPSYMRPSPRNS